MKRIILCVVLLLPVLAVAQYNRNSSRNSNRTTGRSAAPVADSSYQVLSTRNMFVPDRTVPRADRTSEDFGPRVRGPNVEKVLTGVVMQEGAADGSPVAFFFDPNNDETVRVTVGQSLDGKIVRSISFEGVDVASGRSIRTIHVGDNLSGVAAASFTEPETPEATSQPTSGPSQFVSSPANSLEERMRQRRQQEK